MILGLYCACRMRSTILLYGCALSVPSCLHVGDETDKS
jgi:hypothetical protein